jgi:dienelactone hydrolase
MDAHREQIAEFIGFTPAPEPPAPTILHREAGDGFTLTRLQFMAPDQDRIDAFLFEPVERRPSGAVVALHQHNSQWSIGKSEIAGLSGDPLQAFGPALARRGVAVLAPDAIGFEARCATASDGASLAPTLTKPGSSADGWLQYYNQMAHRLVRGDLLMRKMLLDAHSALSVLRRLEPDGVALGVLGHSMGGAVALFLGALDTRIAFTCASGAVGSYRRRLARGVGLEMAMVIPGFASRFDLDDVMRCIAPRRLFVVSADDDIASEDASALVDEVRPAFQHVDGAERLTHLRVHGGHALDRRRFDAIVDWVVLHGEETRRSAAV